MIYNISLKKKELKLWSGPLNHTYSNAQYICIHTQLMQCICKINVSYFSLYSLQSFKCFMQKVFECTLGKEKISFSNFSCMFLNPKFEFYLIDLISHIWETSWNKLKKHSVTRNCSDLSLFDQIVLVTSKILQILGLQSRIYS